MTLVVFGLSTTGWVGEGAQTDRGDSKTKPGSSHCEGTRPSALRSREAIIAADVRLNLPAGRCFLFDMFKNLTSPRSV